MKKTSIIILALALLATMTQCKKDNGAATSDNSENTFAITLSVDGNDGSRAVVNPATGTVDFESGDKIYVASGGKYVGSLTHDGNHHFIGNITNPVEGEPLYFYFLGNVTPQETLGAGTTEECSVIISDQTQHLPVISYAPSNEDFSLTSTSYTAHLLNKCALAKFSVTTPSTLPVCVTGMKNKVTVDFTNNTMTPSQDGEGVIMLSAGNGENVEKWAILLPQEALEEGEQGSAYSVGGNYTGTRPAIPEILENGYLSDGIAVAVDFEVFPMGGAKGLFSINSYGQVFFSQGNLQYQASTNTWKFAENQWYIVGNANSNIGSNNSGWIDLFGWGTSGYDHGAICYQPWSTSTNYGDYYAYGSSSYNLYDQTGQADWGYNAIMNGGNQENSGWRTLTNEEWIYILANRTASTVNGTANARYAKATVAGVEGVILFPDVYTHPDEVAQPTGINVAGSNWSGNNYSVADFALMEANGAVFLPAAGQRWGTSMLQNGIVGSYWSSTTDDVNNVSNVYFSNGSLYPNSYTSSASGRQYGVSVRLVRNAE